MPEVHRSPTDHINEAILQMGEPRTFLHILATYTKHQVFCPFLRTVLCTLTPSASFITVPCQTPARMRAMAKNTQRCLIFILRRSTFVVRRPRFVA